MNFRSFNIRAVVCGFLVFGVSCLAQIEHDSMVQFDKMTERKEPGFFKRAAKDTPAEQLAHADKLRSFGALKKAEKAYRSLVYTWHDSSQAAKAQMNYAEILLERGYDKKAFDEFQYLIDYFAGQFDYDSVLKKQFKIANQIMTQVHWDILFFPGYTTPERALPLYDQIVKNAPEWENTPEAQFNIGLIHEQSGDYWSAVEAYEIVRSRYSDSDYAAGGAFRRAHCLYELSENSPRDEQLCRRAQMAVGGFLRSFPGDPNEPAAREYEEELKNRLEDMYYDIAVYYDKKARKSSAAVIAYSDFLKHFPSSDKAVEANLRRAELEAQLERTNEK